MKFSIYILLFYSVITFSSCNDDPPEKSHEPTPYKFPELKFFPTENNIPPDNPMTVEGIKLGRYLFYDGRINGRFDCDSMNSCASCHAQSTGFAGIEDHGKGIGVLGLPTHKTSMPLVNLAFRNKEEFGWTGRAPTIEDDIKGVFLIYEEFNTTHDIAVEAIASIDIYPSMFEAAFGTPEVTIDRIAKAIAQFVRTLNSNNSKYDKYLRKEIPNLNPSEFRGLQMFMSEKADCFHCHGQPALLTDNVYHNNGKDSLFVGQDDRFGVTGDPFDKGAYRTPTLRNIAVRKAFMHDGRFRSLEEVVDFYAHGLVNSPYVDPLMEKVHLGGNQLSETEKQDLIDFLHTFTDEEFLTNPDFGPPPDLDTGCK
jgi:cytochrome c peroxidase